MEMKNILILFRRTIIRLLDQLCFKIKYQINVRKYKNPDFATIASSSLFNRKWYLFHYEDVRKAGIDPVRHYMVAGWKEGRKPSVFFDGNYYLEMNPDVEAQGLNPLLHFERHGRAGEWKYANIRSSFLPSIKHSFVKLLEESPLAPVPVRMIAFYLPQFHEIPENNLWWGKGFTEWTNVKKGRSLFKGHYQPHVPGELGYYNLLDKKIMARQVELARLYGIGGFCFYFYWFGGKRLLEKPLLNFLDDSTLNLPFCLCWANENWTRTWDGYDSQVLISQSHSPNDDIMFIQHVSRYLNDERYIRIDGKPLLVVYRPGLLPDPMQTAERWRNWMRQNGHGEIYLAYVQSFATNTDPNLFGFDAAIEFPPDKSFDSRVYHGIKPWRRNKILNVFNWAYNIKVSDGNDTPDYKLFRGVCPSWDNTPRKGSAGSILVNNTPELFEKWVGDAVEDTIKRFKNAPDERLVFVNAWNEWAEGAHLEPDKKFGYAWLQAIRNSLSLFSQVTQLNFNDNKKSILFDLLFCQDGFHGGGEYGKAVFQKLVSKVIDNTGSIVYAAINPKLSIDESILHLINNNKDHIRLIHVNDTNDIRRLVNTDLFDAFFTPALVVYSKGYSYQKTAGKELGFRCRHTHITGTLHDIRDLEMAKDYSRIYQFRKAIGCRHEITLSFQEMQNKEKVFNDYAEGLKNMYQHIVDDENVRNVITVSDYSKKSIVTNLIINDKSASKLSVLYSCMKHRYPPAPFSHNGLDYKMIKYLLSINLGRIEKNGSAIAKAMDELFSENMLPGEYYAVLTGIASLASLDIEIRNKDRFIILGFLSPENLEYLYSHAECLVYASLSEGFGYPPIEAMSYRIPSVVSKVTALPEICGDAAVYCNPYDLSSIKNAILQCVGRPPSEEKLTNMYKFITSRQISDLKRLVEIILS